MIKKRLNLLQNSIVISEKLSKSKLLLALQLTTQSSISNKLLENKKTDEFLVSVSKKKVSNLIR